MKAKEKTRITALEIKLMRTAKYTWTDCKRNKDTLKKAEPVLDKISIKRIKFNVLTDTTRETSRTIKILRLSKRPLDDAGRKRSTSGLSP
jgi:hypothetical protein